ncbi:unnamed protein product [Fusarium graminearum]|nr:unnamed protein product [Fusarium graminearum]VTO82727.1 unnamed protein product [Fusarium graminearum]
MPGLARSVAHKSGKETKADGRAYRYWYYHRRRPQTSPLMLQKAHQADPSRNRLYRQALLHNKGQRLFAVIGKMIQDGRVRV